MEIIVRSRQEFARILRDHNINDKTVDSIKNVAFISISDPKMGSSSSDENAEKFFFEGEHDNVIQLCFWDVTKSIELNNGEIIDTINDEQAKELWLFVKKQLQKEVNTFLIHCAAGISRSGGVGKFIAHYLQVTREDNEIEAELYNTNPFIHPNMTVFDKLRKEAGWNEECLRYL